MRYEHITMCNDMRSNDNASIIYQLNRELTRERKLSADFLLFYFFHKILGPGRFRQLVPLINEIIM